MTGGESSTLSANKKDFGLRFHALMEVVVRWLPFGLSRVVAPSFLGFAIINGFTFGIDLMLLMMFRGGLGLPVPLAFTLAYVLAFGLSFVLNRALNFRSHAPMGRQVGWYVLAVLVNYAVVLLGAAELLTALGTPYQLARVAAGAAEAVFMYCALRWVVFRPRARR